AKSNAVKSVFPFRVNLSGAGSSSVTLHKYQAPRFLKTAFMCLSSLKQVKIIFLRAFQYVHGAFLDFFTRSFVPNKVFNLFINTLQPEVWRILKFHGGRCPMVKQFDFDATTNNAFVNADTFVAYARAYRFHADLGIGVPVGFFRAGTVAQLDNMRASAISAANRIIFFMGLVYCGFTLVLCDNRLRSLGIYRIHGV